MPIRRTLKNVVKNYSEAQIKVREATSNDAWGPSTTLMSEIADLTYNVVAYAEIMPILWRRLEDTGRNWRHVYKSLVLLDYLVRNGSERVARECRERAWAIQAIADSFEFAEGADTTGQDRGAGVRERARALTALLRDDDRLRNERAKALKARERFAQNSAAVGSRAALGTSTTTTKYSLRSISPLHSSTVFGDTALGSGGYSEFGSPSLSSLDTSQFGLEAGAGTSLESEFEALRPTSAGEEELQLQLALAMSKEEHEEEQRRQKGDEAKLQMALDESRKNVSSSPTKADPTLNLGETSTSATATSASSDQWALPSASAASLSDIRFKSSSPATIPDPWMSSTLPILPPPPSKLPHPNQQQQQPQQQAATVPSAMGNSAGSEMWFSTGDEFNLGGWGSAQNTVPSSLTTAIGSGSARSSPWESPCHTQSAGNASGAAAAAAFDDEFDMIGTRSRSPASFANFSTVAPSVPPRRVPSGTEDDRNPTDPWDFGLVGHALRQDGSRVGHTPPVAAGAAFTGNDGVASFSSSPLHSALMQPGSLPSAAAVNCGRRSAQDFLGDNAGLVNLDNLFSLPANSAATNPFGFTGGNPVALPVGSTTTNPFGAPPAPPVPVRTHPPVAAAAAQSSSSSLLSSSPSVAAAYILTSTSLSGAAVIAQDASDGEQFVADSTPALANYPQAFNPFL